MLALAIASAFCVSATTLAQTLPTNPTVVNGAAGFQQNGSHLTVTNSPGAVINWQSFSIGSGATTQFVQQNAVSSVFNRVTGGDPSQIAGNLISNGRVFLINPSGVTIGAGARIDTAAFVASSLGISNADLVAGRFRFDATPGNGNVVNQGTIVTQSGGFVYFVGRNVENSGVIHTPKGEIILAAGNSVEIINPQSPNLRVEITATQNEAVNLGKLVASGGTIGMFAGTVRQRGVVNASTAEVNAQGRIVFRAKNDIDVAAGSRTEANGPVAGSVTIQAEAGTATVAGLVEAIGTTKPVLEAGLPTPQFTQLATTVKAVPDASNATAPVATQPGQRARTAATAGAASAAMPAADAAGGEISILGDSVVLTGAARIEASGESGGGTILVGGDYQGRTHAVQNARTTIIGGDVLLRADAELGGNGGKVIVWADEATHFVGSIAARGGALRGDGGFAEVSAKGVLYFAPRRAVDLRAPSGAVGFLLLDPADVSIENGGAEVGTFGGTSPKVYGNASANATSIIRWSTIETQLASANVIITTSYTGAGVSQPGNITINDGHTYNNANNLTLLAHNNVIVASGKNVKNDGAGGIALLSGWDGTSAVTAPVFSATGGAVIVDGSITTKGGDIRIRAGTTAGTTLRSNLATDGGKVDLSAAGLISLGANVTISTQTTATVNAGAIDLGSVAISGAGRSLVLDASSSGAGAAGVVTLGDVAGVTRLSALTVKGATINVTGTNYLTDGASGGITLTATGAGANINLQGGGATTFDSDATGGTGQNAGAINVTGTLGGALAVSFDSSANDTGTANGGALALPGFDATTRITGLTLDTRGAGAGASGLLTLGGDINTNNGAVSFANVGNAITLAASVIIDTSDGTVAGGAVDLGGKVVNAGSAGVQSLSIDTTGTSNGAINLGALGTGTRLGVVAASGGALSLLGDIQGIAVNLSGVSGVTLGADVTLNTILAVNGGVVNLGSVAVNSDATARSLTIQANGSATQGTVTAGALGVGAALKALSVSGGTIGLGTLNTAGAGASGVGGAININASGSGHNVTVGAITAGGASAATGAAGGAVTIGAANGTVGTAGIDTRGGAGSAGDGGTGGAVGITSSGALVVGGAVQAQGGNATGGNGAAAGAVSMNAGAGTLSVQGINTLAGTGGTQGAGKDVSLTGGGGITLAGNTSVGGNAVLSAINGGVTQSAGTITVAGTTSLTANAANAISIDQSGNDFSGSLSVVSGKDVTLRDASGIQFGASNISGALSLTVGGAITQVAAITVAGGLAIDTSSAANLGNVSINASGGTGTLSLSGAGLKVAGDLSIQAGSRAVDFGSILDVGGAIAVTTSGAITNNGNVHAVGGPLQTNAFIVATGGGPDFALQQSHITNAPSSGAQIVLANTPYTASNAKTAQAAVSLGLANNIAGPISVKTVDPGVAAGTTTNYNLTQGGALAFGGKKLTVVAGAAAGAVSLAAANTGDAQFVFNGTAATSLVTAGNLTVSGSMTTLTTNSAQLSLGSTSIATDANLTASASITQVAGSVLDVGGILSLSSVGAITLDQANTLANLGAIQRGGALTINDTTGGLTLTGSATSGTTNNAVSISTAGGALALGSHGISGTGVTLTGVGITQSAGSTIAAGSGTALLDGGGSGAITLGGDVSGANITIRNTGAAVMLGGMTTAGTLDVQGGVGAITQSAGKIVNAGSFQANSSSSITLDQANTLVNLGPIQRGGALTINDTTGGLTLTGSATGGNTNNAVSISTAGGALALGGNNITGSGVTLTGAGITQSAASTLDAAAGTVTLAGNAGAIDMAGTVKAATLIASNSGAGNNIVVNGVANLIDVLGSLNSAGGAVSVNDSSGGLLLSAGVAGAGLVSIATADGALALGNHDVTGAGVSLTGRGVTQSAGSVVNGGAGTIAVSGFDGSSRGAIGLDGMLTTTSGAANAVLVHDAASVVLGNVTALNGTLVVGTGQNVVGAVSQAAGRTLNVDRVAASTAGTIALDHLDNRFAVLGAVTSGGAVRIVDADKFTVAGAMQAGGAVTLESNSDITFDATLTSSSGGVTIAAGGGGAAGGMQGSFAASGFAAPGLVLLRNGGINAGAGDILIQATGPVSPPAPSAPTDPVVDKVAVGQLASGYSSNGLVTTGKLTVQTFNKSPGPYQAIDLQNGKVATGNSVGGGVILESILTTKVPNRTTGDDFGNGNIDFKSRSGTNLSGVGTTGNVTLTASSYVINPGQENVYQGRNVVLIANGASDAGDIVVNTTLRNSLINTGKPGGSLTIKAVGSVTLNETVGELVNGNPVNFDHTFTLVAGKNINVNKSIWMGGDLELQANASATSASKPLGDLIPKPGGGSVMFTNGAASVAALAIRAKNITIGTALDPVGGVEFNAQAAIAGIGVDRGISVEAGSNLLIHTIKGGGNSGNLSASAGTATGAGADAAIKLSASRIEIITGGAVALRAGQANGAKADASVRVTAPTLLLSVNKNSVSNTGDDLTDSFYAAAGKAQNGGIANVLVDATTAKSFVVGGDLIIQGGNADATSSAIARVDPSGPMTITAGRGIALIAGSSAQKSSASITNSGQINLLVNQNGLGGNMTMLTNTEEGNPSVGPVASNLIFVGNPNSGVYNIDANDLLNKLPKPIAPNATPVGYFAPPIRLTGGGVVYMSGSGTRSEAFVLSGVDGFFNPAQPDTPVGIARTVINLQDPNKNKNRSDDACP